MQMRFSSCDVPLGLRKDAIEAAFGAHVQGSLDFAAEDPVAVDLKLQTLGDVHIAAIETSPLNLFTPADEDGLVYLSITMAGGGLIDANGDGRVVGPGDVNVMRRNRRCRTLVAKHSSILSIAIPRTSLAPRLGTKGALQAPQMRSRAAARLLESYANTLLTETSDVSPDEQALFAGHLVDLVALTLGAPREEADRSATGGVRSARRRAVKTDIAAHLSDPHLSVDWMAKRHGISPASVRSLFYDEGSSFTDYVLNERLDHARTLLLSPYLRQQTIAALALMAGFNDISWFNQTFRRRFGRTPSDIRNTQGA